MKQTFTSINGDITYTTNDKGNYFYVIAGGEKYRISKAEFEKAREDIEKTRKALEELDQREEPKTEKKATKRVRRSKDIAYEGNGVTLTAKQADFIKHLPDTCFWENGLDSTPWIDCLCDEIGGQFAGKPMTVGAMVSTICEKGLAERAVEKITDLGTGRTRKSTYLYLTKIGKEVAKDLGLE